MAGPSGPPRRSVADPWAESRRADGQPGRPPMFASPRPRSCAGVVIPPRRHAGYCRGGVCGSTRYAPAERSPYRAPKPATGPRPRQRGHHPGARPRCTRGRGSSPARLGDVVGPHEVPGRRPAGARGARPHQDRRDEHRGAPDRAAQAAGRGRDDPCQDRSAGHLAPRPARRGRRGLRLRPSRSSERCWRPPVSRRSRRRSRSPSPWPTPSRERRVVPQSVAARQLANPFLAPDFSSAAKSKARPHQLAGWELLTPLLRSFENAASGASACMALPEPASLRAPGGLELMPHQARGGCRCRGRSPDVPAR